jgi:hypothetical protein
MGTLPQSITNYSIYVPSRDRREKNSGKFERLSNYVLEDKSDAVWEPNQWQGGELILRTGEGEQRRLIVENSVKDSDGPGTITIYNNLPALSETIESYEIVLDCAKTILYANWRSPKHQWNKYNEDIYQYTRRYSDIGPAPTPVSFDFGDGSVAIGLNDVRPNGWAVNYLDKPGVDYCENNTWPDGDAPVRKRIIIQNPSTKTTEQIASMDGRIAYGETGTNCNQVNGWERRFE